MDHWATWLTHICSFMPLDSLIASVKHFPKRYRITCVGYELMLSLEIVMDTLTSAFDPPKIITSVVIFSFLQSVQILYATFNNSSQRFLVVPDHNKLHFVNVVHVYFAELNSLECTFQGAKVIGDRLLYLLLFLKWNHEFTRFLPLKMVFFHKFLHPSMSYTFQKWLVANLKWDGNERSGRAFQFIFLTCTSSRLYRSFTTAGQRNSNGWRKFT